MAWPNRLCWVNLFIFRASPYPFLTLILTLSHSKSNPNPNPDTNNDSKLSHNPNLNVNPNPKSKPHPNPNANRYSNLIPKSDTIRQRWNSGNQNLDNKIQIDVTKNCPRKLAGVFCRLEKRRRTGIQGNKNVDKLAKATLNKASYSGKLICWSDLNPKVNAYTQLFSKKIGILRGQTSSMKYSPTWEKTSTKEVKEQAENGRQ
ncbi:hypothetical protein PoB_006383400 [Plakobranchus ocellatus]|uniref:Uncharacterized protein n=1 Tax=Plakobranchus ocellatus TaxID=259542 RepID=A0AAV4CZG3_9GAST|nr:hypothetical protein PoB_006383400 [Plakobranchus ocellatus]